MSVPARQSLFIEGALDNLLGIREVNSFVREKWVGIRDYI